MCARPHAEGDDGAQPNNADDQENYLLLETPFYYMFGVGVGGSYSIGECPHAEGDDGAQPDNADDPDAAAHLASRKGRHQLD